MKILAMDQKMSNAEVLDHITRTRQRHAREDAEDVAAGIKPTARPQNYLNALEKHERHLKSNAYPYMKNPSAYAGTNQDVSLRKLNDDHFTAIHDEVFKKWKECIRKKLISKEEGAEAMEQEQIKKEITEEELLMIHNHAPVTVEMLEPMLENWEERYTRKEMEAIVEVIKDVYRQDELREPGNVKQATEDAADESQKAKELELFKLLSVTDTFAFRAYKTEVATINYGQQVLGSLALRPCGQTHPEGGSGANDSAVEREERLD